MPLPSLNCQDLRTKLESLKLKQSLFDETLDMAVKEKTLKDSVIKEKLKTLKQELIIRQQEIETLLLPSFMQEAESILGEQNFLGPQSIQETFGFTPENIPHIPFDKETLERAKELNQYLILRVDKTPDGTPLTMKTMNEMLKGKTKGKFLFNNDDSGNLQSDALFKDEDFFTKETPKLSWALVSKEVLNDETEKGDSTNKNYLQQTEVIVHYLKDKVFKENTLPKEYQYAIGEFDQVSDEINQLMQNDWQEAVKKLEALSIINLTRQTPAEVLYDTAVTFQSKGERLLEAAYTWTARRYSDDSFVDVGGFGAGGVGVDSDASGYSHYDLGVSFSRRV